MQFIFHSFVVCVFVVTGSFGELPDPKAKYSEGQWDGHGKGKHHTVAKTCPPKFFLEHGYCVKKEEINPTHICPPGTLDTGKSCVAFSPVRYSCPATGHLVDTQCISEKKTLHELFCPAIAPLTEGRCTARFLEPLTCPLGQFLSSDSTKCISKTPVERKCPKHFFLDGLVCVKREYTNPHPECPKEPQFSLENGKCVFDVTVKKICPLGYAEFDGECIKYEPKVKVCPPEYSAVKTECVKKVTVPKELSCPNGGSPVDNCKKEIPVALTPECPDNWKLSGGYCEHVVRRPPSFTCPKDYTFIAGECSREIEYDCSVTTHEVECETPPKHGKEEHSSPRSLYVAREEQKEKYLHREHDKGHHPICHKVPIVHQKTCKRVVTAEGIPYCKAGIYRGGKVCEIVEKEYPQFKCKSIEGPHGTCFVEETSKPIRLCPHGYSIGHGEFCTRTFVKPVILQCPEHTFGPECAKKHEKVCPDGSCTRKLVHEPTLVCPCGFSKVEEKHKLTCLKEEFADFENFCTKGQKEGLACLSSSPVKKEQSSSSFAAIVFCPKHYADNGKLCVEQRFCAATPHCAHDFRLVDSRCVRLLHKLTRCPKGSIYEKGKCWVFEKTAPLSVDTVIPRDKYHH